MNLRRMQKRLRSRTTGLSKNVLPERPEGLGEVGGIALVSERGGLSLLGVLAWVDVDGTPTTLAGYGITDAALAPVRTVVALTATVLASDFVVLVDDDAAGGAVTITLPAAATAGNGFNVVIMKTGTTADVVIVGTINGAASFALVAQYESIKVVTDGTEWFVIEA